MSNASLGNTFIPKIPSQLIYKILSQISPEGLANLCLLWGSLNQTKPKINQNNQLNLTNEQLLIEFNKFVEKFKKKKLHKRKLIDRLVVDFYSNGLNLLQFAQLDSQLLIEKPLIFYWKSNRLLDSNDKEIVINLNDPQLFLNNLLLEISQFYLNHIYISKHPHFPLILIRIQLFDLISDINIQDFKSLSTSDSIVSRKPFFIALPLNSSNLISSYQQDDLISSILLQSIESTLSKTLSVPIRIDKRLNHQPIKSLESLHIIKGNSRFAESLGVWMPYADGIIDISPFDDISNHQTLKKPEQSNLSRLNKISMLRFKGSLNKLKSKSFYMNNNKKRRINESSSIYSSLTPVQNIQFEINNEFRDFTPKIKMKLHGNDIFGGLHELCDLSIINPETIPNWLTGEEGLKSGIIKDDIFIENDSNTNLI